MCGRSPPAPWAGGPPLNPPSKLGAPGLDFQTWDPPDHPTAHPSRILVRIDPHVIDQHLRRKNSSPIRWPRPFSPHSQVEKNKLRPVVKRPSPRLGRRRESSVHIRRLVDVVLDLPLAPNHAVRVPRGRRKPRRMVLSSAVEPGAMYRSLHPVEAFILRIAAVDVFH